MRTRSPEMNRAEKRKRQHHNGEDVGQVNAGRRRRLGWRKSGAQSGYGGPEKLAQPFCVRSINDGRDRAMRPERTNDDRSDHRASPQNVSTPLDVVAAPPSQHKPGYLRPKAHPNHGYRCRVDQTRRDAKHRFNCAAPTRRCLDGSNREKKHKCSHERKECVGS